MLKLKPGTVFLLVQARTVNTNLDNDAISDDARDNFFMTSGDRAFGTNSRIDNLQTKLTVAWVNCLARCAVCLTGSWSGLSRLWPVSTDINLQPFYTTAWMYGYPHQNCVYLHHICIVYLYFLFQASLLANVVEKIIQDLSGNSKFYVPGYSQTLVARVR